MGFRVFLGLLAAWAALALEAPIAHAQDGTTLSLTEHAERSLPRDMLVAELAVDAIDTEPAKVQAQINRRMASALAHAKDAPPVTVSTGSYSLFQDHVDKGPSRWNGRQTLRLEAKDQAALLQLVGTLQGDGLAVQSLGAVLSPEATRAVEDELTDAALHRVRERAARIAATLDLQVAQIDKLTVSNAGVPMQPMRYNFSAAAAAAPAMPPPVLAPGDATVSVSVQAEIELTSK